MIEHGYNIYRSRYEKTARASREAGKRFITDIELLAFTRVLDVDIIELLTLGE